MKNNIWKQTATRFITGDYFINWDLVKRETQKAKDEVAKMEGL